MQVREFLADSIAQVRADGWEGAADVAYDLYSGFLWSKVSRRVGGRHVFDHEWDVLVVLDACRADLLREVADDYPFVADVAAVRSVASTSREWLLKTFAPARRRATTRSAYVTANPFSDSTLDPSAVASLDEVWRDEWDEELGTVPPGPVTDRAIARWRSGPPDRMIVHYMQPHFPSVPDPSFGSGIELDAVGDEWDSVWDQLRKGRVSREEVWEAYRTNLRAVLDSVEVLLSNVDADRVVLTADHGNSFGSWGVYGHPPAAIPAVRTVPWCVTSAEDRGTRHTGDVTGTKTPSVGAGREGVDDADAPEAPDGVDDEVTSKLRDLGYL